MSDGKEMKARIGLSGNPVVFMKYQKLFIAAFNSRVNWADLYVHIILLKSSSVRH